MTGHLPNSPYVWGNFLKYLDIWEISYNWKINTLRFSKEFGELPRFRYLWNFPEYQFLVNYPDFPNAWVFGKFPKCFQRKFPIAVVFRKFPYTWVFGKFLRFYKFLLESDDGVFVQFVEISRMLNCLGNFPNAWVLGKFTKCLVFLEILKMPSFFFEIPRISFIPVGIW